MRLIDADRLRAEVEATAYPMRAAVMRLIDTAPTVNCWHDSRVEMSKRRPQSSLYMVSGAWTFYVCDYHDGCFWQLDNDAGQWVQLGPKDVEQWTEIPYPPDYEIDETEE